jgi:mannonate dehydratase
MRRTRETDAVFPHACTFKDGYLHRGVAPGHGVDIDDKLRAKYPCKPSALPVNRLADGSMWNG